MSASTEHEARKKREEEAQGREAAEEARRVAELDAALAREYHEEAQQEALRREAEMEAARKEEAKHVAEGQFWTRSGEPLSIYDRDGISELKLQPDGSFTLKYATRRDGLNKSAAGQYELSGSQVACTVESASASGFQGLVPSSYSGVLQIDLSGWKKAQASFSPDDVCDAIVENDLSLLKSYIAENPRAVSTSNWQLAAASFEGHLECIRLLLEGKVDPMVQNKFGQTALHYAATKGHEEYVQLLLESRAGVLHVTDRDDMTPLIAAAAAYESNLRCVQLLVEAGSNLYARDKWGDTAAILAAKCNKKDYEAYLLKAQEMQPELNITQECNSKAQGNSEKCQI
jgi:hypothetical protein